MGRRKPAACTCPRGMRAADCLVPGHRASGLVDLEEEMRATAEARLELLGADDDHVGELIAWAPP